MTDSQRARAIELHNAGWGYKRIGKELSISPKTVESHIQHYKRDNGAQTVKEINIKDGILKDIEKECAITYLMDKYKISERVLNATLEDIKEEGYQVTELNGKVSLLKDIIPQENRLTHNWNGEKIIKFGLWGDPQFNSKYVQITHLNKYFDILEEEGITTTYCTGDVDEGEEMRVGHKYECYTQGADDHIKEIVKNFPKRSGIKTYFITGNHDLSIVKRCGYDIGFAIQAQREDLIYLGQNAATIELTPNCTLELRHPGDGTAYAISYKPQKIVEAIQGGDKPKIMAIGHYHKAEYLPENRNVHTIQTGCFQGQTPFMKSKGLAAHVGGWICEANVNEEGTITRFKAEFIPFYKMIKDDYLNWR